MTTRFRAASTDLLRCNETDCPEQHPVSAVPGWWQDWDEQDLISCPTCRAVMGLDPLTTEDIEEYKAHARWMIGAA